MFTTETWQHSIRHIIIHIRHIIIHIRHIIRPGSTPASRRASSATFSRRAFFFCLIFHFIYLPALRRASSAAFSRRARLFFYLLFFFLPRAAPVYFVFRPRAAQSLLLSSDAPVIFLGKKISNGKKKRQCFRSMLRHHT